jgi:hypothetical protein
MAKFALPRLFCRRERRVLTAQGWLLILALVATLLWGMVTHLYGFFAIQAPLPNAQALVIEGWLTDDKLDDVIQEFRRHPYELLITTGNTLPRGTYLSEYKTYADMSRASLLKLAPDRGINPAKIIAVSAPGAVRDRTYASATALRDWLAQGHPELHRFNLITSGVHARRSQFLFQKALGSQNQVGVLAMGDSDYDADRWWASSQGFKMVVLELIGYVYTGVFNRLD